MAPFPGGVLIKSTTGSILGAVGVSGASGDEDEYCALRGIVESGYEVKTVPEAKDHKCTTVNEPDSKL